MDKDQQIWALAVMGKRSYKEERIEDQRNLPLMYLLQVPIVHAELPLIFRSHMESFLSSILGVLQVPALLGWLNMMDCGEAWFIGADMTLCIV